MLCKVICASLGYETRVYIEGENVDVSSPSEVKRLLGYGVIEVGVEKETVAVEKKTVADTPLGIPPRKNKSKKR